MAKLKLTNAIAEDLKTAASDSFIDSLMGRGETPMRRSVIAYGLL